MRIHSGTGSFGFYRNILPFPDSLFSTASTALIITLVVFVMLGIIAILFDTIFVHPLTEIHCKMRSEMEINYCDDSASIWICDNR